MDARWQDKLTGSSVSVDDVTLGDRFHGSKKRPLTIYATVSASHELVYHRGDAPGKSFIDY